VISVVATFFLDKRRGYEELFNDISSFHKQKSVLTEEV